MSVMNPKFFAGEMKVVNNSQAVAYRAATGGSVARAARPVTSLARSVRDTCAVIFDAIRGRYDR